MSEKIKIESFEQLTQEIECIDYPSSNVAEYGGIPQNSYYSYISSNFLDGIVNYFDNVRIFIINRYGVEHGHFRTEEEKQSVLSIVDPLERYKKTAQLLHTVHPKMASYDDNFVFGETVNSFYFLWYDRDCSDSCIMRISKEDFDLSYDEFVNLVISYHSTSYYDCWRHTQMPDPILLEIFPGEKPSGWISS